MENAGKAAGVSERGHLPGGRVLAGFGGFFPFASIRILSSAGEILGSTA